MLLNCYLISVLIIVSNISNVRSDFSKLHNIDFKPPQFLRHKTDLFYKAPQGLTDVIIRRGTLFEFSLKLGKNYDHQKVDVSFTFKTRFDTYTVQLPSYNQQRWKMEQFHGKRVIHVKVYINDDAPVGIWEMFAVLKDKNGKVEQRIPVPNRIIILFNPWSPGDAVYMNSDSNLDEYVLNEKGLIWSYDWDKYKKRLWLFNQFKPGILDAVLFIMNRAELNSIQRGDPVRVVRDLSWLINVNSDKEGVLQGKWEEPYHEFDGRMATRPTDWMSSASILYQYYQQKGKPVAYGQCWVFAGLFTTILRALGIPARPVSAFAAAHDFTGDMTADVHFDEFGFLSQNHSDRIWNFHVWTQAWMSRKRDLQNDTYSGWQNADGTPQGIHGGRMQVGPASSRAVKEADIRKPYETAFVYMEQNADEVHWQHGKIKEVKRHSIGLATVTKAVGSDNYEDITSSFKHEEKTAEERLSYKKACSSLNLQCVSLQRRDLQQQQRSRSKAVTVSIEMKPVSKIGSNVRIVLVLKNPSMKDQKVDVALRVTSTYYSGIDGNIIKNVNLPNVLVLGGKKRKLKFDLRPNDYVDKLKDFFTNRVEAVVKNRNGHIENDMARLVFIAPPLRIDCPPQVNVSEEFKCVIDMLNPLDRPLEDCYFIVEGQRIKRKIVKVDTIDAGEEASVDVKLKSLIPWYETIVASFVSRTVKDIRGSVEVHIVGNEEMQFNG